MKYLSKLLLFGEYTVINGSRALAVPYERYFGEWVQTNSPDQRLLDFVDYLDQATGRSFLNIAAFRNTCMEGWIFDSNIPLGYGLGSSGALCAAVYDRFARRPILRDDISGLLPLKQQLAWMESHFHGSSSGTDPLISYLNYPVVIHPEQGIYRVALPDSSQAPYRLFLLDTGISRSTGPLVDRYLENCKASTFAARISREVVPTVDQLIDDYLEGAWEAVHTGMQQISQLQWRYFPEMIPGKVQSIWQEGLEAGTYALKICGAGGGGFLLGITAQESVIADLQWNFTCHVL